VKVPGARGECAVDLGAQYFAPGGWDTYIAFRRCFGLDRPALLTRFSASLTIFRVGQEAPLLVSPTRGMGAGAALAVCAPENVRRLAGVAAFQWRAHALFRNPESAAGLTVRQWLARLPLSPAVRDEVVRPLLVALSNTSADRLDQTAPIDFAHAMASRRPPQSSYWVPNDGIGGTLLAIERALVQASPRLVVHRGRPIVSVRAAPDGAWIVRDAAGETLRADRVIMAAPPSEAAAMLRDEPSAEAAVRDLARLEYKDVDIALHTDRSYVRDDLGGLYDIGLRYDGTQSTTMILCAIAPRYGTVLETWIYDPSELKRLDQKGALLGSARFRHPVVSPEFLSRQRDLVQRTSHPGLHFAGGWTTPFESQDSAIRSAFRAVREFAPPHALASWQARLPNLGVQA
jgi:predicted NAD/FAD-binding protein